MIRRIILFLLAVLPLAAGAQPHFDYATGEPGSRAYLRLPQGASEVKAVLYCHQNMTEEVLFRSEPFCREMDRLGVAMAFVQRGSQNWDPATDCQPRFEALMADFARGTGHPEIVMIMGEYEWWEARLLPALAFRMMYPDSRISFLCDAGRGHFDLCPETQDYIAKFIEKALHNPHPEGGVYFSRWYEDGHETMDPHEQFWYPDEEMVRLARARYAAVRGKRMQYLSARVNGELLVYDPDKHIKMNATVRGDTFTVEPVFVDETRNRPGLLRDGSRAPVVGHYFMRGGRRRRFLQARRPGTEHSGQEVITCRFFRIFAQN